MSFKSIKQLLTSDTVVAYFDQTKEMGLVMDASPWGLSAILTQKTPDKRIEGLLRMQADHCLELNPGVK